MTHDAAMMLRVTALVLIAMLSACGGLSEYEVKRDAEYRPSCRPYTIESEADDTIRCQGSCNAAELGGTTLPCEGLQDWRCEVCYGGPAPAQFEIKDPGIGNRAETFRAWEEQLLRGR